MKALETYYNGYQFRSRLEARWAVWFDALSIEYSYEPEGFQLSTGEYYLPDFYLPEFPLWIEIKPLTADISDHHRWQDVLPEIASKYSRAESLAYHLAKNFVLNDENILDRFVKDSDDEGNCVYFDETVATVICYGDPGNYVTHVYFCCREKMRFWHNVYSFAQCCRCEHVYFGGNDITLYGMGTGCSCCFVSEETKQIISAVRQARSARFGT